MSKVEVTIVNKQNNQATSFVVSTKNNPELLQPIVDFATEQANRAASDANDAAIRGWPLAASRSFETARQNMHIVATIGLHATRPENANNKEEDKS